MVNLDDEERLALQHIVAQVVLLNALHIAAIAAGDQERAVRLERKAKLLADALTECAKP